MICVVVIISGRLVIRRLGVCFSFDRLNYGIDGDRFDYGFDGTGEWYTVGDRGRIDDEGYLYIVDRAKDLIIVSGFNVHPAEVEDVLTTHPAVDGAAVIGVEHPHTGEAVKAYVVLVPGAAVEEDELIDHVSAHLARYKAPKKVVAVDTVGRAVNGKLDYRHVKELATERTVSG